MLKHLFVTLHDVVLKDEDKRQVTHKDEVPMRIVKQMVRVS